MKSAFLPAVCTIAGSVLGFAAHNLWRKRHRKAAVAAIVDSGLNAGGWNPDEMTGAVGKTQPGVLAKNEIPYALFTVIRLRPGNTLDASIVSAALSKIPAVTAELASKYDDGKGNCGSTVAVGTPGSNPHRLVSVIAGSKGLWSSLQLEVPAFGVFEDLKSELTQEVMFRARYLEPTASSTGIESKGKDEKQSDAANTPGEDDNYVLLLCKSLTLDLCYQLSKKILNSLGSQVVEFDWTVGFRHGKGQDLTGFFDGTGNRDYNLGLLAGDAVIHADDTKSTDAIGGSFVYFGRFVHDLAKFHSFDQESKSKIIGRVYGVEATLKAPRHGPANPVHEVPIPSDSHLARAHANLYRQAYPYIRNNVEGLAFAAFARKFGELEMPIKIMAGCYKGLSEGRSDNLFKFTKNVTSGFYYAPSLAQLQALAQPR